MPLSCSSSGCKRRLCWSNCTGFSNGCFSKEVEFSSQFPLTMNILVGFWATKISCPKFFRIIYMKSGIFAFCRTWRRLFIQSLDSQRNECWSLQLFQVRRLEVDLLWTYIQLIVSRGFTSFCGNFYLLLKYKILVFVRIKV